MKLFLTLFATCLLTVCKGQLRPGTDSIKLHHTTAAKLFIDAQQKALAEQKAAMLEQDIANLKLAIASLQTTVKELEEKDTARLNAISTYEREIVLKMQQLKAAQDEVARLAKDLKRQKRKTKLTAFAGLLLSGAVGWVISR